MSVTREFSQDEVKAYRKRGKVPENWWEMRIAARSRKEYLGYPTQKPMALLERIIAACSNEGDIVFDPFCGCGTSIYAAHKLGRQWMGCDITIHAVRLVKDTLRTRYGLHEKRDYKVEGIPTSTESAQELFNRDPHQFQKWVIDDLCRGRSTEKKSRDRGVDGIVEFNVYDPKQPGKYERRNMVISVKGGKNLQPAFVRELIGTMRMNRESDMAGLITQQPPTNEMRYAAKMAGKYECNGLEYARVQIRTVEELLKQNYFSTPHGVVPLRERQSRLDGTHREQPVKKP